jgi:hypothetical protein
MSKEYEAHMARVSGKEGQVDAAQQAANELRAEVNQKVRQNAYRQAHRSCSTGHVAQTHRRKDEAPVAVSHTTHCIGYRAWR